jgi:hypothetical protein
LGRLSPLNYQLTKSSPKTGLPAKIRNQIITLQKGQKKTITASGLKCTIKRDKCFTIQFGNIEVDAEGKLDTIILLDSLDFLRNGKSILDVRLNKQQLNENAAAAALRTISKSRGATIKALFKRDLFYNRLGYLSNSQMKRRLATGFWLNISATDTILKFTNSAGLSLSFKRPVANPHFMFEIRDNQDFHNELTCFVTASKEHLLNWALAVIKDYPPLAEVAEKEEVRKIDITPDNSTLIAKSLIYGKNPFVAVAAKMFE